MKRKWFRHARPSRTLRLETFRGALGWPTATSNFLELPLAPRNVVNLSSTSVSRRPGPSSRGPNSFTLEEELLVLLQSVSFGRADRNTRHSHAHLVGSPQTDDHWRLASFGGVCWGIGARSAAEHAPATTLSSLAQSPDQSPKSGQASMSTILTAVLKSLLSSLPSSPTPTFSGLPTLPRRKACRPRSKQKHAATCQLRRPTSAID